MKTTLTIAALFAVLLLTGSDAPNPGTRAGRANPCR